MAKPAKPESFEITEYGQEHEIPGRVQGVIKEIITDQARDVPSVGIQVGFTGNLVKLTYHAYEMFLPTRLKEVEHAAKKGLDETVKNLEKEYKTRTGEALTFKERKEMANNSSHKVTLNERYMYSSWRFFELSSDE